jgi:hypothetical protein
MRTEPLFHATRPWVNALLPSMGLLVALSGPVARAADTQPRLTIVEPAAVLMRGTGRADAALGQALQAGDIVELPNAPSAFARLEFADGGFVELGPGARVMLRPRLNAPAAREPLMYVLGGWVKLVAGKGSELTLRSPTLSLSTRGASVIDLQSGEASVFAEVGDTRLSVRRGNAESAQAVTAGQFMVARAADAPQLAARPPASWLQTVPRPFKDRLPLLRDRFAAAETPKLVSRPVTYGEVEVWLKAEPALRVPLMPRWRPRSGDADFRAELVKNMRAHPEWDRVLFPEKYRDELEPRGATSAR